MNKIKKITLFALIFLIAPIIATGIIQFFMLIVLGISMDETGKIMILFFMYILSFLLILMLLD